MSNLRLTFKKNLVIYIKAAVITHAIAKNENAHRHKPMSVLVDVLQERMLIMVMSLYPKICFLSRKERVIFMPV